MTEALLPESFDDFRSVKFWDGFFKERGQKPFEWYGEWRQLKPFLLRDCRPGKACLVVGCGNSELSADLYDSGCQDVTNIDFSKLVIAAMMRKNLRQRPRMKWKVADMTALQFSEASFDNVLDKGGLDALMGEDSDESSAAGQKLLDGVSRVISPGGAYLCITLAQSHVLREPLFGRESKATIIIEHKSKGCLTIDNPPAGLLLEHFKRGWLLELHAVPPSPDMAQSPLQPIFVRAEKVVPGSTSGGSNICSITRSAKAPNSEQLEEICQILEEAAQKALDEAEGAQSRAKDPAQDFDQLKPGTRRVSPLPHRPGKLGGAEQGRFTAVVLDVAGAAADAATQPCCVFLVPQGRESEWLFATEEGQWQVAGQCRCRRVILVILGRSHQFSTSSAVQSELSPLVCPLAPHSVRGIDGAIPIMTTQAGIGKRRVLAEVQSPMSGKIIVEDVATEADGQTAYVRRMVFAENSNLIQSEARLMEAASLNTGTQVQQPGNRKGHKAKLPKTALLPPLKLDNSKLAMEYHKHIMAGILACSRPTVTEDSRQLSSLVIGLGGGGLPLFMSSYAGLQTTVVELDEQVSRLAADYFGCHANPGLQIKVGDGLTAVEQVDTGSLDFLVVDAGSSNASLAISCPPAAFLEPRFLGQAAAALKEHGVLVVNCVTRSEAAFAAAVKAIKGAFSEVRISMLEDDVNKIIFAANKNVFNNWAQRLSPEAIAKILEGRLSNKKVQIVAGELSGLDLQSTEY